MLAPTRLHPLHLDGRHSSFHHTLIPGTQRDSLYTLDGLVANDTSIQPDTMSTDTAGASEIVFALAWTLGYRYAPRLADLADHRLWRITPDADYGPLNGLARNRINTDLIAAQWDQICRLTASLEARTVTPSTIMRTLQRGPNPSSLARGLVELGRVVKTLHILNYCDDATTDATSSGSSTAAKAATRSPETRSTDAEANSGSATRPDKRTSLAPSA